MNPLIEHVGPAALVLHRCEVHPRHGLGHCHRNHQPRGQDPQDGPRRLHLPLRMNHQ